MRRTLSLPLIVGLVTVVVLYLGIRSAQAGRSLHEARRLGELERALITAVAASEKNTRDVLHEHRRHGAKAVPLPLELDVGHSGPDGTVVHRSASADAIRLALRGSPDPDQLIHVDPERVAWLVPGWDHRGALAIAPLDALLDLNRGWVCSRLLGAD